jgi:hypothetical protein
VNDADDASSASDEEDDADASSASDEEDVASSASDEEIGEDDAGVNDDENSDPTGVEDLEEFVEGLEAELDDEIADQFSNYDPNDTQSSGDDDLEGNFGEINQDEIDRMRADTTKEQDDTPMPRLGRSRQHDDESDSDSDDEQDEAPLPRLRRNRQPDYAHLKGRDGDGSLVPTVARPHEFHHAHLILEHIVMTQYNMKQGITKFGEEGKQAMLAELQQLYDRDIMEPVDKYDLTGDERKGALRYLMFLKEKRCGMIKGRRCADGRRRGADIDVPHRCHRMARCGHVRHTRRLHAI